MLDSFSVVFACTKAVPPYDNRKRFVARSCDKMRSTPHSCLSVSSKDAAFPDETRSGVWRACIKPGFDRSGKDELSCELAESAVSSIRSGNNVS